MKGTEINWRKGKCLIPNIEESNDEKDQADEKSGKIKDIPVPSFFSFFTSAEDVSLTFSLHSYPL